MASPLFNGSGVARRAINLGGAHRSSETSHQELMQRAKREREGREEGRRREGAAIKVQVSSWRGSMPWGVVMASVIAGDMSAFYRGRGQASRTRNQLRTEYDRMMMTPTATSSAASSAASIDPDELVHATKRLVLFLAESNQSDIKRLAAWCRAVLVPPRGATAKTPSLFALYLTHSSTWSTLVRQVTLHLLRRASSSPNLPQTPLFVEIVKILCDPSSLTKWKVIPVKGQRTPLEYVLDRKFFELLRTLILEIPTNKPSHPALSATVALTLLPFKAFPPSAPASKASTPATPSPTRQAALSAFIRHILSIELLPSRVPSASLAALVSLPIDEVLATVATDGHLPLDIEDSVHLLANLLFLLHKRVESFTSAKAFINYLLALRSLLDQVPSSAFTDAHKNTVAASSKGKGKEVEVVVIEDSDDESEDDGGVANEAVQRARARLGASSTTRDGDGDVSMTDAAAASTSPSRTFKLCLDRHTTQSLQSVASRDHIAHLLVLSTRYSASSRVPLASFLVSLMVAWPAKRDDVLNALMYSGGSSVNERGGGLLRELFRGYVRSGPLGRILGGAGQDRRLAADSITGSLLDPALAPDWTVLVLLSELYSRCLHTMGDDEFYSTRNPLSLDEVVGLSAMLRNLAFQLYWQEGDLISQQKGRRIAGTRISIEAMRSLAMALLQQIHARDSRRSFTPPDHWLMTSQFDLASFIQTVVYEDEKLDADEENATHGPSHDDNDARGGALSRRPHPRSSANLSKRQMTFISPRLGVLNNIPFVIPFETRVAIFRQFVENDRIRLGLNEFRYDRSRRTTVRVRRTNLAADAFQQMSGLGAGLKSNIQIVFIDEHGMEESGIDGGGLFKELLTSLCKEAFDTDRGLWLETAQRELYPNPHAYAKESSQLAWYTFMGHILGKALYDGILIDVRFAGFFLAKLSCVYPISRQVDDLQSLDPELYSGLIQLKNYPGDVETDMSLNFTVTDEGRSERRYSAWRIKTRTLTQRALPPADFGVSKTVDLIPRGSEIAVTSENRIQYIFLMSHYRLNVQLEKQCAAFFAGLSEIIPERFLRMFNQDELRILVGGIDQPIDIEDLKANTVYGGFAGEEANESIRAFWRVVESFDKEQRSKLVKFVTSCARPPLLGFKELTPKFALRNAGADQDRLPTSSTCVNLLKISEYKDEEMMRQKLLYAINSGAGFDLS
ncbi:BZ3500_MvSof-1268-A1-R1_Chr3-3g06425 [Microbotryum saponariae]|uniref:HECT-type E3 ubiquitin transferase n=1 Tax=Microbotryum saponariae TaxID=289078 RepID=A0A2X0NAF9_9BASI|nr:BZ3500_MvSof-1268-A1-R1_Chr3-3g06425 [Microbotryum saponariae]SDA04392.1 BZ3501_MvSof-1269-A2-R1_Chr3-2g06112 [Microbotryum saponariae]